MVPVPESSTFSRKIINLFAGMAYGSPDLPRAFRAAGYVCHSIESIFAVTTTRQVNPELILCSDSDRHTLIIDAKSGANLKPDQLTRYSLITSEALVKRAFTSKSAADRHDVLFIGQEEFADRLLLGSATVPSPRRVLCVAAEPVRSVEETDAEGADRGQQSIPFGDSEGAPLLFGIRRLENDFATKTLNEAFNPTLVVDWDVVPTNFLPVDHESENWEFAQYIFPEIIASLLNGTETLRVEDVAKSFIRHWNFIAAAYRKALLERIRLVLKIAAQKRFAPYMTFGSKGSSKRDIVLKIPEKLNENPGAVRSQLRRRLRELMNDLNSPQIAIVYED